MIPDITRRPWSVNIRKFVLSASSLDELVSLGTLTPQASRFLEASVAAGLNIIVAGGTQAGKTTLLNCLAASIPGRERVITAEEVFELRLPLPDVVAMQTRQPNLEGTGEIRLRRLVKEALRMRPDRIVVGEVRQEECLDFLLIPLVYLLLAVFRVQSAAFGVTEAARQAGRAYARADDPASAAEVGTAAARLALQDQGITWTGSPEFCGSDGCSLAPGATVRTRIRYTVPLPFVGSIFGPGRAGIPVTGVHTEVVDRFKEAPP